MLTYAWYAALVASPRALPDGLILVFQHPVRRYRETSASISNMRLETKSRWTPATCPTSGSGKNFLPGGSTGTDCDIPFASCCSKIITTCSISFITAHASSAARDPLSCLQYSGRSEQGASQGSPAPHCPDCMTSVEPFWTPSHKIAAKPIVCSLDPVELCAGKLQKRFINHRGLLRRDGVSAYIAVDLKMKKSYLKNYVQHPNQVVDILYFELRKQT